MKMDQNKMWFVILTWTLLLAAQQTMAFTNEHEVTCLKDLYQHLDKPAQLKSWEASDPCLDSWLGVTCSDSSVFELNLRNLNLSGNLRLHLENLNSLKKLDLSNNKIRGEMPFTWPKKLTHVNLSYNELYGRIVDYCQGAIIEMDLSFNQLTGDTTEIPCLMMIPSLNLNGNNLTFNIKETETIEKGVKRSLLMANQPPQGTGGRSLVWFLLGFACFGVLGAKACKANSKYQERMVSFVNRDGTITYPCTGCSRTFDDANSLISHLSTKHNELKFPCPKPHCPCIYKNKSELGLHFDNKHPGERLK